MSIDAKMKDACLDKSFQAHVLDFFMHLHVLNFPCTHLTKAGGHQGGRSGQPGEGLGQREACQRIYGF
jgi:hypothetical protein